MEKDEIKRISRGHTVYKLADGTRVPGVTAVTGQLGKPQLVRWANQLGLDGIDSSKYTDESASVGTLAHAMIQAHLGGREIDAKRYSPLQIDLAENALLSFYDWLNRHKLKPLLLETPLCSEALRYGGTPDCYCLLDGRPTLLDFKTGKSIYDDLPVQISAYKRLLEEKGYPVESCHILRVGRDESEGFEERAVADTERNFEIFLRLLDVYYLKKELKWA